MRARLALLLLLGIVFLASVSVSLEEKPSRKKCLQRCERERDLYRRQRCQDRCKLVPEREEQEEEEREYPRPHPRPEEREEEEWRGQHRREDPEERERMRQRERERERERAKEEKRRRREKEEQQEERGVSYPFHLSSRRFHTLFKNQYGHIRVLQRFDQRSTQLQNLRDYRVSEFTSKPNTLLLPHHVDADSLLVVLSGRAIIIFVNPDNRESYYLDRGYAQRIPAGTTFYLVNPDDKENLRVIKLVISVNKPGNFVNFFLSSSEDQQSYLQEFSENILEASFDTEFEEINRVLFGEKEQKQGEESQQEGVIVKLSKEQIRELSVSEHAKSSSRKTKSFEYEPFNLRSRNPVCSNKFGKLFEITPEKNLQLRDLDIFLNSVDINEGALFLPYYNSRATSILVINEGKAHVELVGLSEQQMQQEKTLEVHRYVAELSENDIFVIPAAYPVVINATSNLNFLAFGINAKNNQRNFLAGAKDNIISQIHRQVKDLAFQGSAQDVEKLLENQRESCFVNAQPHQKEEGKRGRKGPLSPILGALY
ncbi:beta-conglycinin beta subunit 1 [Cajanus cajan]|uniref:beta-conglycinin beta subunit 1 n=1 Tax=Cajanus cajan TaxID=3821 RepID=UPI00098DD1F6|nr:beta-conglycinin beta subunit 1 [Cajanus cajan]